MWTRHQSNSDDIWEACGLHLEITGPMCYNHDDGYGNDGDDFAHTNGFAKTYAAINTKIHNV